VWDVEAATRRGDPTIGLLSGGSGRQELLDAGAIAVYAYPTELLERLDEALSEDGSSVR
jgi:phosphoglycolate phosphatase-like HAD superfamily hydrolase